MIRKYVILFIAIEVAVFVCPKLAMSRTWSVPHFYSRPKVAFFFEDDMPTGIYERAKRFCDITDCDKKQYAKNLCRNHYRQKYHKEKEIAYQKEWRLKNKKHCIEYSKEYYNKNKNHCLVYNKQWLKDHKEYRRKYHKEYAKENKERKIKYRKQHYAKNRKVVLEHVKEYRKTPKGKAVQRASHHKRRLLTSDLVKETAQLVYEDNIKQYGRLTCILCLKPIEFGQGSLEHKTPLSRGGTNDYDNLGIAHRGCNCKKHTKTLEEWQRDESLIMKDS